LVYGYRYEYKKIYQRPENTYSNNWSIKAFVRFSDTVGISIHDFEQFESGYASGNHRYMTGEASFKKLKEWSQKGASIILAPQASFSTQASDKPTYSKEAVAA
jgi:homoserine dehydrogenase